MKLHLTKITFIVAVAVALASSVKSIAADIVTFEAESGTLGADWSTVGGTPTYITITTDQPGEAPTNAARVASYSVTFPSAGTYKLYGRVRVGPGAANDDSFFYGNGFGVKSPTDGAAWIRCNNLDVVGFTNSSDVVAGTGSAGTTVWKWISLSDATGSSGETPISFTVPPGSLTQTFQIGARENGFDMDKFAFGTSGASITVSDLDNGALSPPAAPTGLAAPPGESLVSLSWTASSGATSYNVKRATVSGGPYTTITNVTATSVINTGLSNGTTYYFVVSALNANGESADSSETNATPVALPPVAPTGLAATAGNFQVSLGWAASLGATSYNVKRATVSGGPYTTITNVTATSVINTGLSNGTTYYFVVSALNANGESADSSQVSATPTATPPGLSGVLHVFTAPVNGTNSDGANPAAGLALSGGVLCGTTLNGGSQAAGTAFYMTPDGSTFVSVRSFASTTDARNPAGELAVSGNGFFGASFGGGSAGVGSIFLGQTNGSDSVIRSLSAMSANTATNSGGASPSALLALSGGTLYGTTTAGGAGANGTVFSQTTNGTTFSVLHNFSLLNSQTGTNTDGAVPWGGLIVSGNTLYGTASAGGAGGAGVVFSVRTDGSGFTTLYSFSPMDTLAATNAGGATPYGGLVLSNGTLYGTTYAGGLGGRGTIFSIQTNGLGFAVLHQFTATNPTTFTNSDGASPCAGLILSGNVLYGTASAGGSGAAGTVFSLNLNGPQFATLQSFAALASNGTNTTGAFPVAPVLQLGNSLYGTTFSGGSGAVGTVFSVALPTPPAPPAAPVRLTATAGNAQVSLSWTASAGATSYNVKSAIVSGGPYTTVTNVTATNFVNTGLANGTTYYFVVSALNTDGESADSSETNATPTAPAPPPQAVIKNIVNNLDGSVTLNFLGGPNSTNVIQFTADLTPPVTWQSISTNTADANGVWQFTDTNNSNRFYRSYAP